MKIPAPIITAYNHENKVIIQCGDSRAELDPDSTQRFASDLVVASCRAFDEHDLADRTQRIPMQYLRYTAILEEDEAEVCVHCWIAGETSLNAEHIGYGWIEDEGVLEVELLEKRTVTAADYRDSAHKKYFDQALIDETVLVFEDATD